MIPRTDVKNPRQINLPKGRRLKACPTSRGRLVRSNVWSRFQFNNDVSWCVYCEKQYSSSSGVSTLKQHIILCTKTPMDVKYYIADIIKEDPDAIRGESSLKTEKGKEVFIPSARGFNY